MGLHSPCVAAHGIAQLVNRPMANHPSETPKKEPLMVEVRHGCMIPADAVARYKDSELFLWCLERGLRVVHPPTLTIGLYNEPVGACLPSVFY